MSSRLFKHQMASNNRPPVLPNLATGAGEFYTFNKASVSLSKIMSFANVGSTGDTGQAAYSPDGKYVSMVSSRNGMAIYKRVDGGYVKVFGKTGQFYVTSWTPDSKYVSFGIYAQDGTHTVYRVDPNDTFTKITTNTNPYDGSGFRPYVSTFSGSGKYFMTGGESSPYLRFHKFGGGVFTELSTAGLGLPADVVATYGGSTSFDNLFVVPTSIANPTSLRMYSIDPVTDVVTQFVSREAVLDNQARVARFSKDGKYLAVGTSLAGSRLSHYKFENGTFTKLAAPSVEPVSTVTGLAYTPDNGFLFVSTQDAPFLYVYQRVGDALIHAPLTTEFTVNPRHLSFTL